MGFNVVQVQNFTEGNNDRYPKFVDLQESRKVVCNETTWTEMYNFSLSGNNNKFLNDLTLFINNRHYFKVVINDITLCELALCDNYDGLERLGGIVIKKDGPFTITINLNNVKYSGNIKVYQKRISGTGDCEVRGYLLSYFEEIIPG